MAEDSELRTRARDPTATCDSISTLPRMMLCYQNIKPTSTQNPVTRDWNYPGVIQTRQPWKHYAHASLCRILPTHTQKCINFLNNFALLLIVYNAKASSSAILDYKTNTVVSKIEISEFTPKADDSTIHRPK